MKKPNRKTDKNVLIVNIHSAFNAGDYALLYQTIHYLQESLGNTTFNLLANWPDEELIKSLGNKTIGSPWYVIRVWDKNKKPRFQVLSFIISFFYLALYKLVLFRKLIPDEWRKIFDTYQETDLVVAVSGNQLFSSGRRSWPLPVVAYPIYLAKVFNKQLIVFPQSIGPLKTNIERKIVKYLYNGVSKLYYRDLETEKLIKSLNITKSNPSFMHDIAFTFPADDSDLPASLISELDHHAMRKKIGITIISAMPSYIPADVIDNYYKCLAEFIDYLINHFSSEVYIFYQVTGPSSDENDALGSDKVLSRLNAKEKEHVHVEADIHSAFELKTAYGLMDIFIASRLHSGIFSFAKHTPTLFIGYLYKTKGVLNSIGLGDLFIDIFNVSTPTLIKLINNLWDNRESYKQQIQSVMKQIEADLSQFPHEIKKGVYSNDN